MALFTQYVALTFKSVDERLWCDLRPLMKTLQVLQQYIQTWFFFFETMVENLWCLTEQCIHIGLFVYQYFTTGKLDFC